MVEPDVLTGEHLVVTSSSLGCPLGPVVLEIVLAFLTRSLDILVGLHQRIIQFGLVHRNVLGLFGV